MRRCAITCVLLLLAALRAWSWSQIDSVILAECRAQGVPFAVAEAVAGRESSWDAHAVGDDGGSVGLMQLQVRYLRWFAREFNAGRWFDPFDAVSSARIGVRYLAWLHERYGDWWLSLVAYNEGPQWTDAGIYFVSSQAYATAILKEANRGE